MQYTDLSGSLSGTLNLAGSPYAIQSDSYVPEDSVLIIDPGVEIRFNGFYKLTVEGKLQAIGSMDKMILFSSTPANKNNDRGNWSGIVFTNPDVNSILEYCRVEDGAVFINGAEEIRGAIHCNNSSPIIRKCLLVENGYNAIYVDSSAAPLIDGCTITNNAFSGIRCNNGAKPLIRNSIIVTNDDYGVNAEINSKSAPRIQFTDIWDNFTTDVFGIDTTGFPGLISINPEFADPQSDYHLLSHSPCIDAGDTEAIVDPDGTRRDIGVYFYDQSNPSEIRNALSGTITIDYSPYLITSSIWVEEGDTLTIEPGVELRFNAKTNLRFSFDIYGTLIAEGTSSLPIIITSNKELPEKDDWQSLHFYQNSSSSILSHTQVYNCSEIVFESDIEVNNCVFQNIKYYLVVNGSDPSFDNCVFSNMGIAGLKCMESANPVVKHSVFANNQGYGIFIINDSSPLISNNIIYDNMSCGIRTSDFSYPQVINNTIVNNYYYGIWLTDNSDAILRNNIFADNAKGGIICVYSSLPDMEYNDSYGHSFEGEDTNFENTPENVGVWSTINANGDSCDIYYNISLDPMLSEDGKYTLQPGSPCIGAGFDETTGSATDMGAYGGPEGNWSPPSTE